MLVAERFGNRLAAGGRLRRINGKGALDNEHEVRLPGMEVVGESVGGELGRAPRISETAPGEPRNHRTSEEASKS